MIEELRNRIRKSIDRRLEKCEKANVMHELRTFAKESYLFYGTVSVKDVYRAALKDRMDFRVALDRAGKGLFDPLTSTCEIENTPTVTERRYYRKRGLPVPPVY